MAKYTTITVKNGGLEMEVANLGGIITKLLTPDSNGKMGDIVLGCKTQADYLKQSCYLGALIGRVCNRIGGASATIAGKKYKFDANDGKNTLHGGKDSFDRAYWDICECSGEDWKGVNLHYLSAHMQNGFPGNLDVNVFYKLTDNAELVIEYNATTDAPTICALTNHTYFDLSAGEAENILDHHIKINADYFTPPSAQLVPTGEIVSVKGTPLDLRKFKKIREGVEAESQLIVDAHGGYDHNYVLPNSNGDLIQAAVVYEPISGRSMEVLTTEPGMQFYSGNFLNKVKGKGRIYNCHAGFCLETQHFPDAPNKPHFSGIDLNPEDVYSSTTIYRFGRLSSES